MVTKVLFVAEKVLFGVVKVLFGVLKVFFISTKVLLVHVFSKVLLISQKLISDVTKVDSRLRTSRKAK